jgi:ARG/rhodanese/phosphatase superfamily protein
MNILRDTFSALSVGTPQQFENLSVFPLIGAPGHMPSYETLDEALGGGRLQVTETSEAGSVPEIKVLNGGDRSVLIIDGEELVGAKQNRTVNLTILVPARSEIVVPVTCVEAGRWHPRSRQFSSSPRTHFAEGRAAKSRQVTESLRTLGTPAADQGEVWRSIAAKASRLQAHSQTDAMADVFEAHAVSVDAYVHAIRVAPGQRGAVFAVNGAVAGLDLFDSPRALEALLPKLVRGYAIDAIDRRPATQKPARPVSRESVDELLKEVAQLEASRFPAIGSGEFWRLSSSAMSGGALVESGTVVHLSVFSQ